MAKYNVIVSMDVRPYPELHELSAAMILARYWKTDVRFVRRGAGRSPDIWAKNVFWEIKSPVGGGKRTIQNNMREATWQSKNVVIDLRRCKLATDRALSRIRHELSHQVRGTKRVIVILKDSSVVDVK